MPRVFLFNNKCNAHIIDLRDTTRNIRAESYFNINR